MALESADNRGAVLSSRPDLRQRWLRIMPAVFVTYSLAYVDRANYGFGAAAGLAETLHITSSQSALLGSLFFLSYFLFQIPGTAYARRHSTRRLLAFSLAAWGVLASLTGVIRTFWMLAIDRLLLGAVESFTMPCLLILLTSWFARAERSRANTLLILGNPVTVLWMSAVTGYVIHLVGWQMAFIIEGVPSVIWAAIWYAVVRVRPREAKWLSNDSAEELDAVLSHEQTSIPGMPNLARALKNANAILLGMTHFSWSVGVYGFVLWLPLMIRRGSSSGIALTGLLSAVPYLFAILLMLLASYFSDRSLKRPRFVWPFLLAAGAAFLGSYLSASTSFWISYGFLIVAGAAMYAPYGPFFAIVPETFPSNVAGEVMALVNSMGAAGSFVGSLLVGWLLGYTGNSRAGFLLMSVALMVSGGLCLLLRSATPQSREIRADVVVAE